MKYPIAKNGIFATVQGEGVLMGTPMVFIRLAGCSVACQLCDTDYSVHERLTVYEIWHRVRSCAAQSLEWVFITGGEPADHDLHPLIHEFSLERGMRVALVTSGAKSLGEASRYIDFVSVSPHGTPEQLAITAARQLNLVPGLNGLRLSDWDEFARSPQTSRFQHRWVTPLAIDGKLQNVAECAEFVRFHPSWRLGIQAHKVWGVA